MQAFQTGPRSPRGAVALLIVSTLLVAVGWTLAGDSLAAGKPPAGRAGNVGMNMSAAEMKNMSDADMARWVRDFYETHPTVGRLTPESAPKDTFYATGTEFNADHNLGSQADTVRIFSGQSVQWHWLDGSHTVTSGTGSGDPDVGLEFDAPLNSLSPNFTHFFQFSGEYDFFCRPHEFLGMKGVVIVTDPVAADTFFAKLSTFDADNNSATVVDTAFITTGQSILWQWQTSIHTVTNGTGSADPGAGSLFDVDLDQDNEVFVYQFNQAGTYPFFCRVHEAFNMKGVVVVTDPVSVQPGPAGKQIGFASEPEPNPTTGRVSFRLAMPTGGRATVRVFDTRGQLVAVPIDRDMAAGTFPVTWDGTLRDGGRAMTGVYYLRVTLPGYHDSRSVVLTH